ncbi:unnamed protein product [Sympodiomycopsis kandeliae]
MSETATDLRLPMETKAERKQRREEKRRRKAEKKAKKKAKKAQELQAQELISNGVEDGPDDSGAEELMSRTNTNHALSPTSFMQERPQKKQKRSKKDKTAKQQNYLPDIAAVDSTPAPVLPETSHRQIHDPFAPQSSSSVDSAPQPSTSSTSVDDAPQPSNSDVASGGLPNGNPFAPQQSNLNGTSTVRPPENPFAPQQANLNGTSTVRPQSSPFAPAFTDMLDSSPPFFPNRHQSIPRDQLSSRATTPAASTSRNDDRPHEPAQPAAKYDAADFPPGFDMSALDDATNEDQTKAATADPSSSNSTPRSLRPRTSRPTAAALNAILSSASGKRSTATTGGASGRGRVSTSRRNNTGESLAGSKEATVTDAAGLTEKQILSEKLYQPHQIKWLQEEGLITNLIKGKFSKEEDRTIKEAFTGWCQSNGFEREDGIELIHHRTPDQAPLYAGLTTHLTASVEGRSLRAVRRYVLENFHAAKTGPWSDEEVKELAKLYGQLGSKWSLIGERMGRLSRDVRVKYRDYLAQRPQPPAATTAPSTAASTSASTASAKTSRWTREEVETLERVVRDHCEKLSLDVDGGNLPWKAISIPLQRKTQACILKWDEMRAKQKSGQDPYASANGEGVYHSSRDDITLIRQILDTQTEALDRDDVKLIKWGEIIDGEEKVGLPFSKKIVSKAFTRILVRLHKDVPCTAPQEDDRRTLSLRESLTNYALPLATQAFNEWISEGGIKSHRGGKIGQKWSDSRREKHEQGSAERQKEKQSKEAEKFARKATREQKKAEKLATQKEKRKNKQDAQVENQSPRKGTKASKMKGKTTSSLTDQPNEEVEKPVRKRKRINASTPEPSAAATRAESISPKKKRGRPSKAAKAERDQQEGEIDMGDVIDSDDE